MNTVKERPTETVSAVAAALAYLACYLLGVRDQTVYLALGVVLGFLPTAITWAVVLARGQA